VYGGCLSLSLSVCLGVEVIHVWRFIRRNFLRCQDADDDDDVEVFLQRFLSAETMNTADDASSSSSSSFLFWPADRCPVDLQLLKPSSIELLTKTCSSSFSWRSSGHHHHVYVIL